MTGNDAGRGAPGSGSRLGSGNDAGRGAPGSGSQLGSGNDADRGAPGSGSRVGKRGVSTPNRSRKPTWVGKRRRRPRPTSPWPADTTNPTASNLGSGGSSASKQLEVATRSRALHREARTGPFKCGEATRTRLSMKGRLHSAIEWRLSAASVTAGCLAADTRRHELRRMTENAVAEPAGCCEIRRMTETLADRVRLAHSHKRSRGRRDPGASCARGPQMIAGQAGSGCVLRPWATNDRGAGRIGVRLAPAGHK